MKVLAILTGIATGERSSDGIYPQDTVNHLVGKKLHDFALTLKTFSKETKVPSQKEAKRGL